MKKIKFVHNLKDHGQKSPEIIVPILIDLINPKSVIDVGCGVGNFLRVCKEQGVKRIKGIDGDWVNRQMLFNNINDEEFLVKDLEKEINLDEKYDLAISFEVAEHLKPESANVFVKNLTNLSDIIVFSAAIPFQGGQNHLNEQWMDYWIEKFERKGFKSYDVLRPLFWDIKELSWWYKQNSILFAKDINDNFLDRVKVNMGYDKTFIKIHPDLYMIKSKLLSDFLEGNQSIKVILGSLYLAIKRKLFGYIRKNK